tara:strand:- start:672 stop:1820 length:1149 start_codon:yes stop_codon:yes gene_type:complete
MGGAAEGITSGLDKPRQQYAPGGDVEEQFSRTRALFEKQGLLDKPLTGRQELSRFLIPFGLNFATATPRGGGFSGLLASAAGAAKDPVTDLFARRDEAAKDRKELDQAILGDVIDRDFRRTQQDALLKAEKEEQIRELQNNIDLEKQKGINANNELIKEQENAMALLQEEYRLIGESGAGGKQFDIGKDAKIANLVKGFDDEKLKLTDERAQIMTDIGDLGMGTADQNNRIKQIDVRLKSIADLRADILNQASLIEKIGTLEQTDQLNNIIDANMAKGMEYEEAFKAALEQFKFLQNLADGGRAGYQTGGPAEPIKEEDSPVQELSYQELRTRLPSTISDQVVQLIANSKQALLDFAEIRTQQDVDQFNQLYDVTLTLPQEG